MHNCTCTCHAECSKPLKKPRLIILVRHGESESNRDKGVNEKIPNHLIPLTSRGWSEARNAGVELLKLLNMDGNCKSVIESLSQKYRVEDDRRNMLKTSECNNMKKKIDRSIVFYTSPYRRTKETLKGILEIIDDFNEISAEIKLTEDEKYEPCSKKKHAIWPNNMMIPVGEYENNTHTALKHKDTCCYLRYKVKDDPRIREQDFGNYQNVSSMNDVMEERKNYGHFFYRFPQGESAADVYDRVASFQESLFRKFERRTEANHRDVVVLVTHGIFARIFLMKWFRWTYEEYESFINVPNGCLIVIELDEATDRYVLKTELPKWTTNTA